MYGRLAQMRGYAHKFISCATFCSNHTSLCSSWKAWFLGILRGRGLSHHALPVTPSSFTCHVSLLSSSWKSVLLIFICVRRVVNPYSFSPCLLLLLAAICYDEVCPPASKTIMKQKKKKGGERGWGRRRRRTDPAAWESPWQQRHSWGLFVISCHT